MIHVDRTPKRTALLELMEQRGADSLLLTGTAALSWYLDGARTHIDLASGPVLTVRVTADGDDVYLQANEAARMIGEELPTDVTVHTRPWHEPLEITAQLRETDVAAELQALRRTLSPSDLARLRELGTDAATVLTDALSAATPQMTGFELAALVARGVVERGADPLVILVGGESRGSVRHPLPTADPLGSRAMLVVCARRHGLIANATRWVRFGSRSAQELESDRRILEVEADAFALTRPGAPLHDVLAGIAAAYPAHGFPADEWLGHHQGGAAGFDTRDPLATPAESSVVALGQAFAWNPTAWSAEAGPAKVEDTVLVTDGQVDVLTVDPRWPTVTARGVARPDVLER